MVASASGIVALVKKLITASVMNIAAKLLPANRPNIATPPASAVSLAMRIRLPWRSASTPQSIGANIRDDWLTAISSPIWTAVMPTESK